LIVDTQHRQVGDGRELPGLGDIRHPGEMDHRIDHGDVVHENSRAIDAHMVAHTVDYARRV
jgi:hypothetical protein